MLCFGVVNNVGRRGMNRIIDQLYIIGANRVQRRKKTYRGKRMRYTERFNNIPKYLLDNKIHKFHSYDLQTRCIEVQTLPKGNTY